VNVCAADLHIHSVLSPCAGDDMTPLNIVAWAADEGLGMIAVCDHNSAANAAAAQDAAGGALTVLAGIEITSAEECHVLGLFPDAARAEAAGEEIAGTLPAADDDYERIFGEQLVVDAHGELRGRETRALATASAFDVNGAVELVHRHGGLAIAAHLDRAGFGIIAQLGFFPTDAGFDGIEVSRHVAPESPRDAEFGAYGLPVLRSSDAHYLGDIGRARTLLHVQEPTFAELALALRGRGGRSVGRA
jgi:hypothetical protein